MATFLLAVLTLQGADSAAPPTMQPWKTLVGQWRGVGQVRRGSTQGAWQVKGEWRWDFEKQPKLVYTAKSGKYIQSAQVDSLDTGKLRLMIDKVTFSAQEAKGESSLVFEAEEPLKNGLARVSMRVVAGGDRLVMRLEQRRPSGRFSLLGEVGYTRVGSRFGQGKSYVECVVTGGLGTIPVTFEGKTYYVCCTGCKEYFDDDPAGVLAEYAKRKAEAAASEESTANRSKSSKNSD